MNKALILKIIEIRLFIVDLLCCENGVKMPFFVRGFTREWTDGFGIFLFERASRVLELGNFFLKKMYFLDFLKDR